MIFGVMLMLLKQLRKKGLNGTRTLTSARTVQCSTRLSSQLEAGPTPKWPDSSSGGALHCHRRESQGSSPVQAWIFKAFLFFFATAQLA